MAQQGKSTWIIKSVAQKTHNTFNAQLFATLGCLGNPIMTFIRFKSNKYNDIAVLTEVTELEVTALTKKPKDKEFLITVLVSLDDDVDSVIEFFDKYTDKLLEFFKITDGHDPYLELFINYLGTPEDSFQSQKIKADLLKILAKLEIELVFTITGSFEE